MKAGDLVTVDNYLYPQLKDEVGILVRRHETHFRTNQWVVYIGGRFHPFAIQESDMELASERR